MTVHGSLESQLITRVDTLGEALIMKSADLQRERERARAAVKMLPPGFHDIHVSIRHELQFPHKTRYGHAVTALLNLIEAHQWRIFNECEKWMGNLLGADRTEEFIRPLNGHHRGLMVFLAVREEQLAASAWEVNRKLRKTECPYRIWDYFWAVLADPVVFRNRSFVAIGDRIEYKLPGDYRHVPSMLVRAHSIKVEPVPLKAKPNGVDRYHLAATKLIV